METDLPATSVDPDQTALVLQSSLIWVYTGCYSTNYCVENISLVVQERDLAKGPCHVGSGYSKHFSQPVDLLTSEYSPKMHRLYMHKGKCTDAQADSELQIRGVRDNFSYFSMKTLCCDPSLSRRF